MEPNAPFWQNSTYWLELGFPSILFVLAFLAMLWGVFKRKYIKRGWVWLFILLTIIVLVMSNGIRYIGVELVRNNQYWALNLMNNILDYNQYILGFFAAIILFFNRNQWAALPMICILALPAITRYSIWFVNLAIWYAQGYF